MLLSWHNYRLLQALTAAMRVAIAEGRFAAVPVATSAPGTPSASAG
ncbi:hypothetical protein ACRAWD_08495 [Caulobacter segnis]